MVKFVWKVEPFDFAQGKSGEWKKKEERGKK
jgi:hypothetical protein